MRRAAGWGLAVLGVILLLLGGLWLLQGLGLVRIDPVACVGDCAPVVGPDAGWAVTGLLVVLAAAGLVTVGRRWVRDGHGRGGAR